ncbi:hypothetical protein [Streptomyces sp. NPDC002044]|uniref:hypothetical protein n=1 Tax=Streptomyces sp. NPDC002044 TaxID=3154662 RepID=UPI00331FF879
MFKGFHPRRRARIRPTRLLACAALAAAALATAAPAAHALTAPAPLGAPAAAGATAAATAAVGATALAAVPAGGGPGDEPPHERPDHAYGDLAGSAAGAGRERPGRPAADPVNREAMVASRPLTVRPRTRPAAPPKPPPAPTPHATTALGTAPNERAADLAAHLLPLGTGCALMGVGLGYLGARLRRGI